MITRTDIIVSLERGMRSGFLKAQKAYVPRRSAFVRSAPSDSAFEVYGDMGAVPWPVQNGGQGGDGGTDGRTNAPQVGGLHEGGPITILGGTERGLVVYNQDWNVPIGITHNAINDNNTGDLEMWARNAGSRFEQHKDYICFDALNSGEATTSYGKCYDGLAFFSDSHVDPGAQYTTVQDNKYALVLSLDNFETVQVAGSKFADSRGVPVGLEHNLVVHSQELKRLVAQIVDNREAYDTANREVNPYAGDTQGVAAPGGWLDSTAWFLIDTMNGKPLILQERESPRLVFWDDYTQMASGIRYYSWIARYAVAYGDWRTCIQGNT